MAILEVEHGSQRNLPVIGVRQPPPPELPGFHQVAGVLTREPQTCGRLLRREQLVLLGHGYGKALSLLEESVDRIGRRSATAVYRRACATSSGTPAPSQLDVDKAGPYIARRLISTGDIDGLSWGSASG